MMIDVVLPGTKVTYHGSLVEYHGEMEVIDFHYPMEQINGDDVIRYRLKYGRGWQDYLTNVRPGSFTPHPTIPRQTVSDDDGHA